MTQRRLSLALLLAGLALIAAGLLLWWLAPVDLALHRLLRLGGDQVWARRVAWLSALGGLAAMGPVAIVVAILLRCGWSRRSSSAGCWWRGSS
jgi:hypothetical protein